MFLCDDCTVHRSANFSKSYGPCEDCKKQSLCNDTNGIDFSSIINKN